MFVCKKKMMMIIFEIKLVCFERIIHSNFFSYIIAFISISENVLFKF